MKKKIIYSLLILFCLGISGNIFAQAKLGISKLSFPPTATVGTTTDSVQVTVQNKGNTSYTGRIDLYYSVNNSASYSLTNDSTKYTLLPSGTKNYTIQNFYFDSNKFKPGVNIVVVWPTGNNVAIADSFKTSVLITNPNSVGINNYDLNNNINISPNPVLDNLIINYSETKNDIEQVRIFNVLGEQLFIGSKNKYIVNIKNYPDGIYFVEILFKESNNRIVKKFVKRKE